MINEIYHLFKKNLPYIERSEETVKRILEDKKIRLSRIEMMKGWLAFLSSTIILFIYYAWIKRSKIWVLVTACFCNPKITSYQRALKKSC